MKAMQCRISSFAVRWLMLDFHFVSHCPRTMISVTHRRLLPQEATQRTPASGRALRWANLSLRRLLPRAVTRLLPAPTGGMCIIPRGRAPFFPRQLPPRASSPRCLIVRLANAQLRRRFPTFFNPHLVYFSRYSNSANTAHCRTECSLTAPARRVARVLGNTA